MTGIVYLKKGDVYFHAAFADDAFKIPVIETWEYIGFDQKDGHLFSDIYDQTKQYCFPRGINVDVLDRKHLSEWLLEEHSPQSVGKSYEYRGEFNVRYHSSN